MSPRRRRYCWLSNATCTELEFWQAKQAAGMLKHSFSFALSDSAATNAERCGHVGHRMPGVSCPNGSGTSGTTPKGRCPAF